VNDVLAERVRRKLDAMPDEQAYQVLDYIEFLESKYAERPAGAAPFQKVAETLEDTLRAGRVPVTIIKGTMDAVGKAGKFFEKVAAAGHDVRLVVCQPDRPAGRGQKIQAPPVKLAVPALNAVPKPRNRWAVSSITLLEVW